MADDDAQHHRRIADHFQAQLDTRALEMAAAAKEGVTQMRIHVDSAFGLLREDFKEMKEVRDSQHASNEAKFASISKAIWTAALSFMLLLLGWVFYLATHQH